MHPNVYRLAVHLPNEQTTYFPEGTTVGEAMMRNNSTTLTGWCDFNRKAKSEYEATATLTRNSNDPAPPLPIALTTLYPDYPKIVMWSKSKKVWHLRKRAAGCRPKQSCHIGNCGAHVFCATFRGRALLSASFAYPRCRGHML
jgi:hypothetical protein